MVARRWGVYWVYREGEQRRAMYDGIEQCRVDVILIGFKKKKESDEHGALVKYSSVNVLICHWVMFREVAQSRDPDLGSRAPCRRQVLRRNGSRASVRWILQQYIVLESPYR